MLSNVVAYFSIGIGVLWILWPQVLRGWLVNKASWMVYWALFGLYLYPALLWAYGKWGLKTWFFAAAALMLLGGLIKALIGKAAEKLPLVAFRAAGALSLAQGLITLYGKRPA